MKTSLQKMVWLLSASWLACGLLAQGNPGGPAVPVITLTIHSPATGDSFPLGVDIPIRATAVDSHGAITRLEFLADGHRIGVSEILTLVPIPPGQPVNHEFVWHDAPFGQHELRVRGWGSLEFPVLSAPVTVKVGQIKPASAIHLTQPADLAEFQVGADVELKAEATDPRGLIETVDFYANGEKIGTSVADFCPPCLIPPCPLMPCVLPEAGTTLPHSFVWKAPPEGKYALEARGTDALGSRVISSSARIAVTRPAVASLVFNRPEEGATFSTPGEVPLTVTAVDPHSEIRRVEFFAGEKLLGVSEILTRDVVIPGRPREHHFTWMNPPAGNHTLLAQAVDSAGHKVGSAPRHITVNGAGQLPVVTVTAGARFAVEGDSQNSGLFVLRRTGDLAQPLTVQFEMGGTAHRGADYFVLLDPCWDCLRPDQPVEGNAVTLPAGQASVTLGIVATFDGILAVVEPPTESVTLRVLTPPVIAIPGAMPPYVAGEPAQAEVLIVDRANPHGALVALTAPTPGAEFPVGAPIPVEAVAIDPEGSIRRVEFYAGESLIGVSEITTEDVGIPGQLRVHHFLWLAAPAGEHRLQAKAKSVAGAAVTSRAVPVHVRPANLPTVTIAAGKAQAFERGDLKSRTGSFVVTRHGGPGNGAALDLWVQVGGTAALGLDYRWTTAFPDWTTDLPAFGAFLPVQIPADAAETLVSLEAVPDELAEGPETVSLRLIDPPIQSLGAGLLPIPPSYLIGEPSLAQVEIVDGASVLPTITLTVPGTEFPAGAMIPLTATAVHPNFGIEGIQFFADGQPIGLVAYCCGVCDCAPAPKGVPFSATFEWRGAPAGTHRITARAMIPVSSLLESEPVTVRVGEAVKPSVVLTAPAGGSKFAAGATIHLEATAVHPALGITSLRFFANGTEIGHALYCCEVCFCVAPAPGQPFTGGMDWRNVPAGEYTLTARALTLGDAVLESEPVKITVKPAEPTPRLTIIQPANGATVRAGASVHVVAVGVGRVGGITDVDLLLDGQKVGESHLVFIRPPDADEPVEHEFDVVIPAGSHELVVRDQADAALASPPVTVVGTVAKPSVVLTSPTAGSRFVAPATIHVGATAVHPELGIMSLQFFANGTLIGQVRYCCDLCPCAEPLPGQPFTGAIDWAVTKPGEYRLVAKTVTFGDAVIESEPVTIHVAEAGQPSLVILTPTNGAAFKLGDAVVIDTVGQDAASLVSTVEFYANGVKIGASCTLCVIDAILQPGTPLHNRLEWKPAKAGSYVLTAVGQFGADRKVTSEPVVIRVGETDQPTLAIVLPVSGTVFRQGEKITIDTVGRHPHGWIGNVEFFANGVKIGEHCLSCMIAGLIAPGTPLHNQIEWTPPNEGPYVLTAVGQFEPHAKVTSAPVMIQVRPREHGARLAITRPEDGSSVGAEAPAEVTVVGVGRFGGITDVALLVDGVVAAESHLNFFRPPGADEEVTHTFTVRLPAGAHELVAQDLSDRTVKSPVVRVMALGKQPSLTWNSPADGSRFKLGQTIPLDATAYDPHGLIMEVEFLSGEQVIGNSVFSCLTCRLAPGALLPHHLDWSNAPAGEHVLRVRSVRADGALVISRPLQVVVEGDLPSPSFVARDLPGTYQAGVAFTVRLEARPGAGVAAYVVEDRPPFTLPTPGAPGFLHPYWQVRTISHGGVFDPATGKVKFGPFLDHEPRTLTYELMPNLAVETAEFDGLAAADGASSRIGGDRILSGNVRHPADRDPADDTLVAAELTGYAAAWKREHAWPTGPNPIPMDYVTRAAALWKGGERYQFNHSAGAPPRCWVNAGVALPAGADAVVTVPFAGTALRTRTPRADGSVAVTIRVLAAPGARAFALEERLPDGGNASRVSGDGAWSESSRTLRWGPFFAGVNPVVGYVLSGHGATEGRVSFDGLSLPVHDDAKFADPAAADRLVGVDALPDGSLQVSLESAALNEGAEFELEVSSDLKSWLPAGRFAGEQGGGFAHDSGPNAAEVRFYRAVRKR